MVMPLSGDSQCCSNKVKSPDDHEIGLQDVEHGKERPASERDFFRRGAGPVAVRFRFHVLEEHAVRPRYPTPRWGRRQAFAPVSMAEMLRM